MTVFNGERLEGIHRWHEWFGRRLLSKPHVQDCTWEIEKGTTCWHIDHRDGTRVGVQVTDGALRLDQEAFDALVDELQGRGWYRVLLEGDSGGIRIHPDASTESFDF